jgi:hypothetical protein
MAKKALLVGINKYRIPGADLNGRDDLPIPGGKRGTGCFL